jgi:hypothetical protein
MNNESPTKEPKQALSQVTNELPESINELLEFISESAVIALITEYGGTSLSIPNTACADNKIAVLIGMPDFLKLCRAYGSNQVVLPRCQRAMNILRNRQIVADRHTGLSIAELAIKNKLTERSINLILKNTSENSGAVHDR